MTLPNEIQDREVQKFIETDTGFVAVRTQGSNSPGVSTANTTTTILTAASTYTGTWTDVSSYVSVVTAVLSDQAGTLYMEFSNTGVGNADSTLTYAVAANINDVHRLTVTRQYYRTRFLNGAVNQTSFEITTMFGQHTALSAPLNLTLGQDADSTATRVIEAEQDIAEGKRAGYSFVHEFGHNTVIDTATVPEDVWAGGGVYTGFPTGAAELVTVASSNVNDTSAGSGARTVLISGLDATGNFQSETVILAGTGLVDSANTYFRVSKLAVITSGSSNQAFNAGILSVAHKTTTANIFVKVPIGQNESRVGAYTIPLGFTGYLKALTVHVNPKTSSNIEGVIWLRANGESPRLERPFAANENNMHVDKPYGGIKMLALTDFAIRITTASSNTTAVTAIFDLMLVKD